MIRGPNDQNRVMVLGRTGSGKSQFSIALLSTRNFDEMPWIILDYKGEDLIIDILEATKGTIKKISVNDNPPKAPGLYYMKLNPSMDDEALNLFLMKVHKQGNVGLYIDEGYPVPQGHRSPFNIILTQGRSLHIPIIVLYQRPVYMSRFAIAQADYFAVFEQNNLRDLKTTEDFIKPMKGPKNEVISVYSDLPQYCCLWYDVGAGKTDLLRPAPDRSSIIAAFVKRLKPRKRRALI